MNKIVKKTISDYTRKRGNAQGVARPACAIAIVYFLTTIRLAMLLPPSEWPLKTSAQCILAYVHSPPMQMCHKVPEIIGPQLTQFVQ